MESLRLQQRAEDYEKMGIRPGVVEPWEDGRRDNDRAGANEYWYFDALTGDGTKTVVVYSPKAVDATEQEGGVPNVNITVTTADGQIRHQYLEVGPEQVRYGDGGCDVRFGPHFTKGDLVDYVVHVEPVDGLGCDLQFHALSTPIRPGTGTIVVGENEEMYDAWLSVPNFQVTGTLTYDGAEHAVEGSGYKDHQWMNTPLIPLLHHWLWSRQTFGDYIVVVYDLVAAARWGFERIPMIDIQDQEGNLVFESVEGGTREILDEYFDQQTGKSYPSRMRFSYEKDGKKVVYTITMASLVECKDMYGPADAQTRAGFDAIDAQPVLNRYSGTGELAFTGPGVEVEESGEMIYEFAYMGRPDKRSGL